jgi:hypothetical protein
MSAFGQKFAKKMRDKVATKLLTKFDGREGSTRLAILKQGSITWDPFEGEDVIGPDTKYFMTGVEQTVSEAMVNGATIRSGDKMLSVSVEFEDELGATHKDIIPAVNDKVVIDGANWSIVNTPAADYTGKELIVLYKIQVRK